MHRMGVPWLRRFFCIAVSVAKFAATAADFYVSPRGDDTNPGTLAQPWRTVQKAADSLAPGETAWIRGGVYRELVTIRASGAAPDQWITFRAYEGEKPILDGRRVPLPADSEVALLLIRDCRYVRVQGLELRNFSSRTADVVPCGIFVTGTSEHLQILGNRIHHIATTAKDGNALGLAVYGTANTPIRQLVIDRNEIHHCKLGSSESLVLNGNITEFEVTNNRVHDNNNIGIDFIGFEGTCADPAQDRPRDGVCRDNTVWNIKSFGNPAYGRVYAAGGIYVDGGTRILVERNVVHHCDIGVELASEHAGRSTSEITLRENLIYLNRVGGIFLGGYDELRGATESCFIHHNTLYQNDTRRSGNGELCLQHFVLNNAITHNIFFAGKQRLLIGNLPPHTGNTFDYNLYFAPKGGEPEWEWMSTRYSGFDEYRSATGADAHGLFADPLFTRASAADFQLTPMSPAVDAGDPAFAAAPNETDLEGAPRIIGVRVDLGADEF